MGYQHVDLDMAIIKEDLTEMKLWVSFYPLNAEQQKTVLEDFKSFNDRLRIRFSRVGESIRND